MEEFNENSYNRPQPIPHSQPQEQPASWTPEQAAPQAQEQAASWTPEQAAPQPQEQAASWTPEQAAPQAQEQAAPQAQEEPAAWTQEQAAPQSQEEPASWPDEQAAPQPDEQPAPQQTPPVYTDGGYAYRGTQTEQPVYQFAGNGFTPPPAAPKKKKSHRKAWIPLAIIAALLIGIGGGIGVYKLVDANNSNKAPSETAGMAAQSATEPTTGRDIGVQLNANGLDDYMTPAQIYNEYVGSVVGIANEGTTTNIWGQTTATASSGTGFIISEDGYILTNFHVIDSANALTVTLHDGTEYPATVVGYEGSTCDVALLKIDATGLKPVSIGDSDILQVGEEVCTIGNPLGELTYTLTVGYVSGKGREINTDGTPINMLQTDAAINAGNSGGPLFDINGNVIGITTAKYSGSTNSGTSIEGLGFAIPINDVMDMLEDLQQYGYVKDRAYLGVTVLDAANVTNMKLPDGACINTVADGYCAQEAGLQPGDVIVGIDDQVIGSVTDLSDVLATYKAGDRVKLTVYRSAKYIELTLTLDERPQDTTVTETETEPASQNPFEGFGFQFP